MSISNLNSSLQTGASALGVFSSRLNVNAHNIANVSTDGFSPVAANLADGPKGMQVRVSAITRDGVPLKNGDASQDQPVTGQPSRTDLAREFSSLVMNQRAFQANTVTITTVDEMLGTLLDSSV